MREKEFTLDGFRTLSLEGKKYTISYTVDDDFIVLEDEVFDGIHGFKVFPNEAEVAKSINAYLLAIGLEDKDRLSSIDNYICKANKIMKGLDAIDNSTLAKVLKSDRSEVGYFDLGSGKIVIYSDGEVELHSKQIINLGNINDILHYSSKLAKDILRSNYGVVVGINLNSIVEGFNELNEIYTEYLTTKTTCNVEEQDATNVNAKEITEELPSINKSRELALCLIATRATQHLCNGRKWINEYLVAKDLYLNIYEKIYEDWIISKEPFSFQFIDNKLNANYFKPKESRVTASVV